MAFNILGINHKTAPVALREKVAFSEDRLVAALRALRQEQGVTEAVILSTTIAPGLLAAPPAARNCLNGSNGVQNHLVGGEPLCS